MQDAYAGYAPSPRLFFGAFQGLSSLLASASLRATSTSYSIIVSTLSINTVVTCYTKTMFASMEACRRKRNISKMVSFEDAVDEKPTAHEL